MTSQMGSMSVQTDAVVALAEQIRGGAKGINEQLQQLDSEVAKLRAQWSGQSQEAYDQAQRKWNESLTEMNTLLGQIADTTERIAQGYAYTDQKGVDRFGGTALA
jgi:6 kDa early secretory antigenic target